MGSKEKYLRTGRRPKAVKTDHENSSDFSEISESGVVQWSVDSDLAEKTNPINPGSGLDPARVLGYRSGLGLGSVMDDSGWGFCTEDQLQVILLQNLELLYNEAINKLIELGYDEDVAMKALLKCGHCFGGMDVLTNILHNSLVYLNGGSSVDAMDKPFVDLKHLEEYSLRGMICLLQDVKPHLSKGDAMWCLLMSDLHVGRASVMDIPPLPTSSDRVNEHVNGGGGGSSSSNVKDVDLGPVGVVPSMCRFHGGWGFGSSGDDGFPMNRSCTFNSDSSSVKEIECPKRFNLTPSMKTLLKRNVAAFTAGFRSNPQYIQNQSKVCPSSSADGGDQSSGIAQSGDLEAFKNYDVVSSVVGQFQDLNLDEDLKGHGRKLDQKDEMIVSLIDQIKDLERQVKERKDWAHQKAMQAARKLSHDLTELKTLRMEKEDIQRPKKGKPVIEDTTMELLTDMESSLRKASVQVDRANLAVKRLEIENAEIRAEMEASKLSAAESVKTCKEVAKKEKKFIKKLNAWDKQKNKLQEDIAAEKQKISDLQMQQVQVEAAQKDAEVNWRQEQKAKELALAQLEEERRFKEAAEVNNKRKLETLRLKIEIDFQRQKDDLQRLEQELSRLRASTELQNQQSADLITGSTGEHPHRDIARMLSEFDRFEEDSSEKDEDDSDRECIICMKDEVSVIFLPCAHQVLCGNCNDNFGKKGRAKCPCCRVPIEQRIRVFGAMS